MNYKKIFNNKKILVTGHTGFKGSWLSAYLISFGAKVYGISKDIPTKPSHFNKINLGRRIKKSNMFDLIDKEKLRKKILHIKPDFIFHLAAQSLVGRSYLYPTHTWYSNTFGTINILEVLREVKRETVVVLITSDKVYKNIETSKGYLEDDVIGGGDWSENRLIPDCMRAWLQGRKAIIRSPNSTRPWQHVLDVLNGYLTLAYYLKKKKNGIHGEAFNFGPNPRKNLKVIEILRLIKSYWNSIEWKIVKQKKFKENKLLNLNSNKASKKLKWKPFLNTESSLDLTVKWYKNCSRNNDANYNFTLKQINYFKNLL